MLLPLYHRTLLTRRHLFINSLKLPPNTTRLIKRCSHVRPLSIDPRTLPQRFDVVGHEIMGISIGAVETCIELPRYSIAFDIGRCPLSASSRRIVCLTHLHLDHIGGIGFHAATRLGSKVEPPTYIVPPGTEDGIAEFLKAATNFSGLDLGDAEYTIKPLRPGERFILNRQTAIKSFRTSHTKESQGYVVYSIRRKLLDQYKGKAGHELRALRKNGVDITRMVEIPEVAITGDTRISALHHAIDARQAKVLITEMTFLDDARSVTDARRRGHIHIDEVIRNAHLFENNEAVIFTHFSARYTKDQIERIVRSELPPPLLSKVHLLSGANLRGLQGLEVSKN